jgi:hypothetical protein
LGPILAVGGLRNLAARLRWLVLVCAACVAFLALGGGVRGAAAPVVRVRVAEHAPEVHRVAPTRADSLDRARREPMAARANSEPRAKRSTDSAMLGLPGSAPVWTQRRVLNAPEPAFFKACRALASTAALQLPPCRGPPND